MSLGGKRNFAQSKKAEKVLEFIKDARRTEFKARFGDTLESKPELSKEIVSPVVVKVVEPPKVEVRTKPIEVKAPKKIYGNRIASEEGYFIRDNKVNSKGLFYATS